jgi:hypothetical protein
VADARELMRGLQRMADRVCVLILSSDLPAVDIEIEKGKVRERCLELYPDREQLYEMVYESRFRRLREQFRGESEEFWLREGTVACRVPARPGPEPPDAQSGRSLPPRRTIPSTRNHPGRGGR